MRRRDDENPSPHLRQPHPGEADDPLRPSVPQAFELVCDVRDCGRLWRVVFVVPHKKSGDVFEQHPRDSSPLEEAEDVRHEARLRAVA